MNFKPFIASEKHVAEFTVRAIILGIILGLIFGIGNGYLALKVGTTVSASIPVAVISMAIFRLFFRRASILENNLVQTIASMGEGLAAGVVFTVPALFILGEGPSIFRICLLSILGGILGILFMIPMRRYIIVHEHGKLPFPEGTACAEILKSGEAAGSKAFTASMGILAGALYKICSSALFLWNETTTWMIKPFQRTEFSMDATPALLGVGTIIGPRIAAILFAGGVLGWWVLIPLIHLFGQGNMPIYPGKVPISQMSSEDIWSNYVRYIGVGSVAIGGLLSFFKIIPLLKKTFHFGLKELFQFKADISHIPRTDRDISLRWLFLGSVIIILTLWLFPGLPMNFLTILLLVILGFFFVGVTSLTVGIVGSTSNPVSGMTITTLLITCLIFLSLGWTERIYLIAALTMGIVANVAICLAGTTSQDLKTGHLLGATPRLQQIGEIIGLIIPAIAIAGTLYLLNKAYGFGSSQIPAPQGTLMALIAQGVMNRNIPLTLVIIGVVIGLFMECLRMPILPFAIGLYLPLSLSTSIMLGGVVSLFLQQLSKNSEETSERSILIASGLVAGDACTGVIIALLIVVGVIPASKEAFFPDWVALTLYLSLAIGFFFYASSKSLFFAKRKN
ncbi:MAG: oligopeptide transporter, OPT family [Chlamydiae bacterium]|nr:oligopeptide transporter, OPT family [Chlamydiota bacterium]